MNAKVEKVSFENLTDSPSGSTSIISKDEQLNLIKNVKVQLEVKVGSGTISINDLFSLKPGSVMPLETKTTEGMELLLNGKVVAIGDLVVVDDNFGLQIRDIARG